jgi:hypothetical protein
MVNQQPKSNDPHDKFIKEFIPVVLKNLFNSQTGVAVQLSENLAIDVLCIASLEREQQIKNLPLLGLLGRLVSIHPTIIIEHYSGYLDLEDVDSCILRSAIYWELNKSNVDKSRKVRVTKDSATIPNPLHLDRPFTWIFTAKCGENTLNRWGAIRDPEFGEHVYRLAAPGLSMGIVDLESLPYNADTMLLKMLGKAESAKQAFDDILKLDPRLELRNDIIEVAIKYCVYLEKSELELTEEELKFMAYLTIEAAYQEWVNERRAEGEREGVIKSAIKIVSGRFGANDLTSQIIARLETLSDRQLDEFTSKFFDWQQPSEILTWLTSLPTE